jgi:hypothetical protein
MGKCFYVFFVAIATDQLEIRTGKLLEFYAESFFHFAMIYGIFLLFLFVEFCRKPSTVDEVGESAIPPCCKISNALGGNLCKTSTADSAVFHTTGSTAKFSRHLLVRSA